MTKQEAIEFLIYKGYKTDNFNTNEHITYLYKRTEGADCQTNERSPNLGVSIYSYDDHLSISINIKAEAIDGNWVDTG